MIVKLNEHQPIIGEKIHTWVENSIYEGEIIVGIDDNYIYLDNLTCMDLITYRYVTGDVISTSNRKLSKDKYLPIPNEDCLWYSPQHNKCIIDKVYGHLKLCEYVFRGYKGVGFYVYPGGSSSGNYEYFKRV